VLCYVVVWCVWIIGGMCGICPCVCVCVCMQSLSFKKNMPHSKNESSFSLLFLRIAASGEIVNLISNDAWRVFELCRFLHFSWGGPLALVAVGVLMWFEISWGAITALGTYILFLPMQVCVCYVCMRACVCVCVCVCVYACMRVCAGVWL
jgi:hypothetical protein